MITTTKFHFSTIRHCSIVVPPIGNGYSRSAFPAISCSKWGQMEPRLILQRYCGGKKQFVSLEAKALADPGEIAWRLATICQYRRLMATASTTQLCYAVWRWPISACQSSPLRIQSGQWWRTRSTTTTTTTTTNRRRGTKRRRWWRRWVGQHQQTTTSATVSMRSSTVSRRMTMMRS